MEVIDYAYLESILNKKNLKVTPQRLHILSLIKQFGHMDIDELYLQIKKNYPYMSLATIYKNISVMVENGILNEIKIAQQKTKYELLADFHAHFICTNCKKIEDLDIDISCILKGFDQASVQSVQLQIYGICNACQKKKNLI
ncbi:MAG: Fur family transcriptional regulator [Desulfurella sp.]|jgi:Fe2+ or Zn2+ uptake regulation protein|uniref:Fur family transcriptional regulator n=2 Tax=Desulfurella sp. TaxID=1962857 RepID=UPI0003E095A2|nr:Fur family transcriptional regulator [Desulfurella sp.]AHF96556.1 peroxide stress regulator [Desulfurella acetivorans A63]PMP89094.1 MAG: transcriptional repressor [Desulfurella sp.]HEX14268.1 transcriptional repressor [Desulfurella acetivorans]